MGDVAGECGGGGEGVAAEAGICIGVGNTVRDGNAGGASLGEGDVLLEVRVVVEFLAAGAGGVDDGRFVDSMWGGGGVVEGCEDSGGRGGDGLDVPV